MSRFLEAAAFLVLVPLLAAVTPMAALVVALGLLIVILTGERSGRDAGMSSATTALGEALESRLP